MVVVYQPITMRSVAEKVGAIEAKGLSSTLYSSHGGKEYHDDDEEDNGEDNISAMEAELQDVQNDECLMIELQQDKKDDHQREGAALDTEAEKAALVEELLSTLPTPTMTGATLLATRGMPAVTTTMTRNSRVAMQTAKKKKKKTARSTNNDKNANSTMMKTDLPKTIDVPMDEDSHKILAKTKDFPANDEEANTKVETKIESGNKEDLPAPLLHAATTKNAKNSIQHKKRRKEKQQRRCQHQKNYANEIMDKVSIVDTTPPLKEEEEEEEEQQQQLQRRDASEATSTYYEEDHRQNSSEEEDYATTTIDGLVLSSWRLPEAMQLKQSESPSMQPATETATASKKTTKVHGDVRKSIEGARKATTNTVTKTTIDIPTKVSLSTSSVGLVKERSQQRLNILSALSDDDYYDSRKNKNQNSHDDTPPVKQVRFSLKQPLTMEERLAITQRKLRKANEAIDELQDANGKLLKIGEKFTERIRLLKTQVTKMKQEELATTAKHLEQIRQIRQQQHKKYANLVEAGQLRELQDQVAQYQRHMESVKHETTAREIEHEMDMQELRKQLANANKELDEERQTTERLLEDRLFGDDLYKELRILTQELDEERKRNERLERSLQQQEGKLLQLEEQRGSAKLELFKVEQQRNAAQKELNREREAKSQAQEVQPTSLPLKEGDNATFLENKGILPFGSLDTTVAGISEPQPIWSASSSAAVSGITRTGIFHQDLTAPSLPWKSWWNENKKYSVLKPWKQTLPLCEDHTLVFNSNSVLARDNLPKDNDEALSTTSSKDCDKESVASRNSLQGTKVALVRRAKCLYVYGAGAPAVSANKDLSWAPNNVGCAPAVPKTTVSTNASKVTKTATGEFQSETEQVPKGHSEQNKDGGNSENMDSKANNENTEVIKLLEAAVDGDGSNKQGDIVTGSGSSEFWGLSNSVSTMTRDEIEDVD